MRRLQLSLLGNGNLAAQLTEQIRASRPYDIVAQWGRNDVIDTTGIDLVVEVAAPDAVSNRLPAVLARGLDAIILSVGAFADPQVRESLTPFRRQITVCTGAIGGLDHLRALRRGDSSCQVEIETRKLPRTLEQTWMSATQLSELRTATDPVLLMEDTVSEVTKAFPRSTNVAAAVALAVEDWETTRARVIADPSASITRHIINASSALGDCRFELFNAPSVARPRTSAVTGWAALRAIDDYAFRHGYAATGDFRFG